jgi:pimeloyl-ACP methyl ester carboxylesterase
VRTPNSDVLVLIHGIWMAGLELIPLARRLEGCGFSSHRFRYPSLGRSVAENAAALGRFVRSLDAERVSFVAHSLGGLVLLHLFEQWPDAPPGRAVLLGSPVAGSGVARHMAARPWLRWGLGQSTERGLLGDVPPVPPGREIGAIAGSRPLGVGRFLGGLSAPGDGTVAQSETRAAGLTDWVSYPVSHFQMVLDARVARAVCRFLQEGRFGASSDRP